MPYLYSPDSKGTMRMCTKFQANYLNLDELDKIKHSIVMLLNNEIAAVCIRNFYENFECISAVENALEYGFDWRVENKVGKIGINIHQFQTSNLSQESYFEYAEKFAQVRNWIFSNSIDPIIRLIELLNSLGFNSSLAVDENFGLKYASGNILYQQIASQTHVDTVSFEASDWSISNYAPQQFSSVLLLQKSELGGGEIQIYNKRFDPSDLEYLRMRDKGLRAGFQESIVENVESVIVNFNPGDLVLFSTNYYHKVLESFGLNPRISSLCFFGKDNTNTLRFFI